MKPKFKARELWLFAPFLLIGLAALLYWRWEQVTPADKRGIYVADVQLTPADGFDEERDISHYVVVTLSHSWPRPLWWGQLPKSPYSLDPLAPDKGPQNYYGYKTPYDMLAGGILTTNIAGKTVNVETIKGIYAGYPGEISFDGRDYKIKQIYALRPLPPGVNEIKFEGLYQWRGKAMVEVSRVVRRPNEVLPPAKSHDPGIRLVSVKAAPYRISTTVNAKGTPELFATSRIEIIVQHTAPLPKGQTKHSIKVYDQKLQDSRAPNLKANAMLGISIAYNDTMKPSATPLKLNQSREFFDIILEPSNVTVGPIILLGKISADDKWPLSFKVKLPPRPPATSPAK